MNRFEILPSSPMVQAIEDTDKPRKIGIVKYPWRYLAVGRSFKIPLSENVKFTTINNSCYKWSKKLDRTFRAFQHDDCIEVARIK